MLKSKKLQKWMVFCAVVATAAHFVRADGKFLFSERGDNEFVRITKIGTSPFKVKFSRCRTEESCQVVGKRLGYTLEDIRMPVFKFEEKREKGKLSSAESRDMDALREIIEGIEQPRLLYPKQGYTFVLKGSADHFVKLLEGRVGK